MLQLVETLLSLFTRKCSICAAVCLPFDEECRFTFRNDIPIVRSQFSYHNDAMRKSLFLFRVVKELENENY